LGCLLAISTALPAYTQSNFLGQFVSIKSVSLFFMTANLAAAIAIWFFPKLIKRLTNYSLTKIVLVFYALALLGLAVSTGPWAALLAIILFTVSVNLLWINMDIAVESFSDNASTGRTRAVYFTFINLGWILAPVAATSLIGYSDYSLPFLIAAALVVPVFLIFAYQKKNLKDKNKYRQEKIGVVIRKMWHNKNLRGIFFISLLLQLFYSSAVVYIPLYLHQNLNMSWNVLGPMFSIMLIPFIIFEIPAGIIADKYLGEKEILTVGFVILIVALFLFSYLSIPLVWLWTLLLFFSRVGASLIEAMRESYFFKLVDAENINQINLFRLAVPLSYILGPGIAFLILSFWPLNYLFLFVAIIMLSGLAFTFSLKDSK
jgi:MFS family permease